MRKVPRLLALFGVTAVTRGKISLTALIRKITTYFFIKFYVSVQRKKAFDLFRYGFPQSSSIFAKILKLLITITFCYSYYFLRMHTTYLINMILCDRSI